jgi:hypothetical protein
VGAWDKSIAAAPATQTVSGVGFEPEVVLVASRQRVASPGSERSNNLSFGASDGTRSAAVAIRAEYGVSPTNTVTRVLPTGLGVKMDNAAGDIEALATLTRFTPDGYEVTWSPNDGVPSQNVYLALGSATPTARGVFDIGCDCTQVPEPATLLSLVTLLVLMASRRIRV